MNSRISGFYRKTLAERQAAIKAQIPLTEEDFERLAHGCLDFEHANLAIENCMGVLGLPVGLGLNFVINQRDYIVPMAVEEPSVIAAVSNSAQLVRQCGGFEAVAERGVMRAQIQLVEVADLDAAENAILSAKDQLISEANQSLVRMVARGGGALDLEVHRFDAEQMLVVHLLVDCVDAMGANALNTVAEAMAEPIAELAGARVLLRILSNLADRRLARAKCAIDISLLATKTKSGPDVARDIVLAAKLAEIDPYRAATHNKGVMNGVDAVAIATGNDWRSLEAGAHAYAARNGRYSSLTHWSIVDDKLVGEIELPMAVGTVGGSTKVDASLRVLQKILGCETARELAQVFAAVGLAQNLGALRALASEGIQRGHMSLHARQLALAAGAKPDEVDAIAKEMVESQKISAAYAEELVRARRG